MTVTLLEGHVVDVLEGVPAGHFHCAVTSPPYLWLRAYGTAGQTWEDGWVGELGQEDTPERYVDHLVAVFRSVKRVLRQDGSLWVNLAGCYYNDPGGQNGGALRLRNGEGASSLYPEGGQSGRGLKAKSLAAISEKAMTANAALGRQKRGRHPSFRPLDWVDVPGLFAHAMQADGWTWRSDVVWVKPSALPESVSGTRWERCRVKVASSTAPEGYRPDRPDAPPQAAVNVHFDERTPKGAEWADCPGCQKCAATEGLVLRRGSGRPTKSTERVLLFVKGPGYWFDQEAVRERPAEATIARLAQDVESQEGSWRANGGAKTNGPMRAVGDANGRNLRDWWVLPPEPLKLAHYAAYPSELPSRCIRAGTSEWGCCPVCGAPWARVVGRGQTRAEAGYEGRERVYPKGQATTEANHRGANVFRDGYQPNHYVETTTLGWRPTCRCPGVAEQAPVPARVLDPFAGAGSTLLAADRLGRDATGIELKPEYVELSRRRVTQAAPLLVEVHVVRPACDTTGTDRSGSTEHSQLPLWETAGTA